MRILHCHSQKAFPHEVFVYFHPDINIINQIYSLTEFFEIICDSGFKFFFIFTFYQLFKTNKLN